MSASKTRLPKTHCQALHTSSHIMHSTITLPAQLYSHNGRFLPSSTQYNYKDVYSAPRRNSDCRGYIVRPRFQVTWYTEAVHHDSVTDTVKYRNETDTRLPHIKQAYKKYHINFWSSGSSSTTVMAADGSLKYIDIAAKHRIQLISFAVLENNQCQHMKRFY